MCRIVPQWLVFPSTRETHSGNIDGWIGRKQGFDLLLHIIVRRNDVEEIFDDAKIEVDAERIG